MPDRAGIRRRSRWAWWHSGELVQERFDERDFFLVLLGQLQQMAQELMFQRRRLRRQGQDDLLHLLEEGLFVGDLEQPDLAVLRFDELVHQGLGKPGQLLRGFQRGIEGFPEVRAVMVLGPSQKFNDRLQRGLEHRGVAAGENLLVQEASSQGIPPSKHWITQVPLRTEMDEEEMGEEDFSSSLIFRLCGPPNVEEGIHPNDPLEMLAESHRLKPAPSLGFPEDLGCERHVVIHQPPLNGLFPTIHPLPKRWKGFPQSTTGQTGRCGAEHDPTGHFPHELPSDFRQRLHEPRCRLQHALVQDSPEQPQQPKGDDEPHPSHRHPQQPPQRRHEHEERGQARHDAQHEQRSHLLEREPARRPWPSTLLGFLAFQ